MHCARTLTSQVFNPGGGAAGLIRYADRPGVRNGGDGARGNFQLKGKIPAIDDRPEKVCIARRSPKTDNADKSATIRMDAGCGEEIGAGIIRIMRTTAPATREC